MLGEHSAIYVGALVAIIGGGATLGLIEHQSESSSATPPPTQAPPLPASDADLAGATPSHAGVHGTEAARVAQTTTPNVQQMPRLAVTPFGTLTITPPLVPAGPATSQSASGTPTATTLPTQAGSGSTSPTTTPSHTTQPSRTPEPTQTSEPTQTAEPSQTPEPTETPSTATASPTVAPSTSSPSTSPSGSDGADGDQHRPPRDG